MSNHKIDTELADKLKRSVHKTIELMDRSIESGDPLEYIHALRSVIIHYNTLSYTSRETRDLFWETFYKPFNIKNDE